MRRRGTNAHTINNSPIIEIRLHRQGHTESASIMVQWLARDEWQVSNTHRGCKLLMLVPEAIAPVMNGNAAAPAAPKPVIQAMPPEMSSGGRIAPAWFMTMGKTGPRKKPTKAIQTALDMRCGTSHTASSRLVGNKRCVSVCPDFQLRLLTYPRTRAM